MQQKEETDSKCLIAWCLAREPEEECMQNNKKQTGDPPSAITEQVSMT